MSVYDLYTVHGTCGTCGKTRKIRRDGLFPKHYEAGSRCSGSDSLPISPQDTPSPDSDTTDLPLSENLIRFCSHSRSIKRIPKAARPVVANLLADLLDKVTKNPDSEDCWFDLLSFQPRVLTPNKPLSRTQSSSPPANSLTNLIKIAVANFHSKDQNNKAKLVQPIKHDLTARPSTRDCANRAIINKLEDWDIRGALRIASSSDKVAPQSPATLEKLRAKHPPISEPVDDLLPPSDSPLSEISLDEVTSAIASFKSSSAGGPDGLRPQHLKDLTNRAIGDSATRLISAMSRFMDIVIGGQVHSSVRPFLFGASLIALEKKSGDICPIAVGCTMYIPSLGFQDHM